jgi:phosphoribosylaminoimidazole (AIR) synthetase
MVLVVNPKDVSKVKELLQEQKEAVYEIGTITPIDGEPVKMKNMDSW